MCKCKRVTVPGIYPDRPIKGLVICDECIDKGLGPKAKPKDLQKLMVDLLKLELEELGTLGKDLGLMN
jgi:hypothetical protein